MLCSLKVIKWTFFGFFILLFLMGSWLIFFWDSFFNSYLHKQLLVKPGTYQYNYWLETPFDIRAEIYLFNLTNPNELNRKWFYKKPRFEQVGPFVFGERHKRANIVFNDNQTVSFNSVRTWVFKPEESNASMDDMITIMDPIIVSMSHVVEDEHTIIKKGVHHFVTEYSKKLSVTKSAEELLFKGYDDKMIDLAKKLKLKTFKIPYDKFGFFYARNGSESYDGYYTMWTGESDMMKTGIMTNWNYQNHSTSYDGECGSFDGTTGEVWYPVKQSKTISMFVPDVCSLFTFEFKESTTVNGIEGNRYVATERLFDNGSKYPENKCFKTNEYSGVRDISACKYGAPAFISLPHFEMADDFYRENIDGMYSDPESHKLEITIEPNYGLPVEAWISFQANFLLKGVDEIDIISNMKNTMVPYLWMKVGIVIPEEYALLIKIALKAVMIGQWIGYTLIFISIILFLIGVYLELRIRNISVFSKFSRRSSEHF